MGAELFGRIARKKGFVRESQLANALRFQEELFALGFEKRLGDILVEDGVLSREQLDQVLRLQQINEQGLWSKRFAKIAVKNGLATQEQVDAALETAREGGFQVGIGAVLVDRGFLAPVAVRAIRQAMERIDRSNEAASTVSTPTTGAPGTAKLGVEIEVEPEDLDSALLARRTRDVLFAAVALRDGLVLVPELERALREQARLHPEEPPLEDVLRDRGILSRRELDLVGQALDAAQREKLAIPGYTVEGVLGHGATSIVLRARHELIDRPVAIKLFREEHAATKDVNALVEEARTIARIRHPNVVGLFDVGRLHRRIYYVMELVDGRTLLDLIREKGGLPEREALGIARGICCALEAIHAAGLVHRDVKPLNVLIAKGGIVKLTDLGLAREVGGKDETPDAVYGSPYTISPEQVHGEPVDIRADLYGLGATLFQALTGEPPFDGTNALAVMMRHVTDPVPDPRKRKPGLHEGTAQLVQRLMAKSKDERPSLPAHVIEAIDKLLC